MILKQIRQRLRVAVSREEKRYPMILRVIYLSITIIQNATTIVILHQCVCQLTVHLCGFSPVCLLMCTTSMYCALNGFSSLLQSFQRQTKAFLLLPIWSLLRCCKTEQVPKCHITIKNRGLKEIQIVKFMNKGKGSLKISKTYD